MHTINNENDFSVIMNKKKRLLSTINSLVNIILQFLVIYNDAFFENSLDKVVHTKSH